MTLRLCRDSLEKKQWLSLAVTTNLLKQLFLFLDEMVRFGDEETKRVAVLLRRNIFYEQEVLQLLRSLVESYEAFRMPKSFMANCVVMTHAVLRQMEMYTRTPTLTLTLTLTRYSR